MWASASNGATGTATNPLTPSCPVCPSLKWPLPKSFSLISIIHEGPLALLSHHCQPLKRAERYKAVLCQYAVMLRIAMAWSAGNPSHGRGEACLDITQILLKLSTSCTHKLGGNGQRCHNVGGMYGLLWSQSNYTLEQEAWLSILL